MNSGRANADLMGGVSICSACGYPYSGPGLCSWCRSVQVLTYDAIVRVDGLSGERPRHAAASNPLPANEADALPALASRGVADGPISA